MPIVHKVLFFFNKVILVFFIVFCYSDSAFAQMDMTNFQEPQLYVEFKNATVSEAQKLIEGYDINQKHSCSTLLMYAITDIAQNPSDTSIEKIKLLIEAGANVNQEVCGLTPLHMAAGIPLGANRLVKEMADQAISKVKKGIGYCPYLGKQCKDATPEDMERLKGIFDGLFKHLQKDIEPYISKVMGLLVENGAVINRKSEGSTPLHVAAGGDGRISLIPLKCLIDYGANLDIKNEIGYTALHMAAAAKNTKAIKLLLEAGANPNMRNYKGQTYLELDESDPLNQRILQASDQGDFSL